MADATLAVCGTKSKLQNAAVDDFSLNDTTVKIDPSAYWQLYNRASPPHYPSTSLSRRLTTTLGDVAPTP